MTGKSAAEKRIQEAQRKQAEERRNFILEFTEDPLMGYDTIEEALADCKCSTQVEVLARLLNRENVFISGPAGSGKTSLINKFIKLIDAEFGENFELALTASTGIAAKLIGGRTIHSWAGLGISTKPFNPEEIDGQMMRAASSMRYSDVLIIDEVSMLPAYIFDKLDQAMRHFRKTDEPFGGIQLVLMGDFLQLPPVDKREPGVNAGFIVTSKVWKELDLSICYMDKVHRATDLKLQEVLAKISRGMVDNEAKKIIASRVNKSIDENKTYTTLFTTNQNVERYNQSELDKNPNPLKRFQATLSGDKKKATKLLENQGIPDILELKVGAIVILTANLNHLGKFYANGSIGKIESIVRSSPMIKFNDGSTMILDRKEYIHYEKSDFPITNPTTGKKEYFDIEIARVEQFPLKLGYAITVHKSQGQTFDGVVVDLTKCFTSGLGYVALSRVRSLDDLVILGINDRAYRLDPLSKKISNYIKKKALMGRKEFIDKYEDYELLLTNYIYREVIWKQEDSMSNKRPKTIF